MRKLLLLSFVLLLVHSSLKGVDPHFSQFYATSLYQAPSYAGSTGAPRIIANYRDQWPSLPGYFTTIALSYDTYLHKYNSGIGGMFVHDQAGKDKISTTNVGISYSYKIKLGSYYYLQPGLSSYFVFHNVNGTGLTFGDQLIGNQDLPISNEEFTSQSYSHLDFASSLLFYNEKTWFGTTLDHLMNFSPSLQNNSTYAPIKFSVYGGYKFILQHNMKHRDETSLLLAANFKTQDGISQSDIGAYVFKAPLFCGLWYRGLPFVSNNRAQDALCFLIGYKGNKFSVGYSYDFTISSGLITNTGGAHEISVSYNFPSTYSKRRRTGAVPCPSY